MSIQLIDSENEKDEQQTSAPPKESIRELGGTKIKGRHGNIYCLSIIGQIEGHMVLPSENKATKYEHIIPLLVAIEEDIDIQGLLVVLNTMGGDVEAGLAIAELIAGMSKPTVSLVLGGGHSIGVPLATAADYSFIAPSATMTIHPIRMNGTVISIPQTFDYLVKTQERVVNFITEHSKISAEKLNQLMMNTSQLANDAGTIMYGRDAAAHGIIDSVGTIAEAMDKLQSLVQRKENKN